jgi:hypothetical protein
MYLLRVFVSLFRPQWCEWIRIDPAGGRLGHRTFGFTAVVVNTVAELASPYDAIQSSARSCVVAPPWFGFFPQSRAWRG